MATEERDLLRGAPNAVKEIVCESNDIHAFKPADNVAINCDDVN